MNGRARTLAAIRHQTPDRIPVDAIAVENGLTLDELDLDGRVLAASEYHDSLPVWGVESGGDYGTSRAYPLAGADSVAEVERHPWPEASRFCYAGLCDAARAAQQRHAVRGPYWVAGPLFCTTCNLMGMEAALVKLLDQPAVWEACVQKVFEFSHNYVTRFVEACGEGLDILYLADDFASQRGALFQPELWRRYLKPRYAQLFAIGKQRGLPVWFHSCGDITAVLPDLIDIGLDVWETVQLHALPLSPRELKRQFGRHITFFGGVSTQRLPFASPQEVHVEVARVITELGAGGGYICGPDHHIKPDVPQENARALFDAAREFRRPGYTREAGV